MKKVIKNAIGFTLIEFMIVVSILGIVLATIVPIYKGNTVGFLEQKKKD